MKGWAPKIFKDVVLFPPKVSLEKGNSYSFIPMEDVNGGYKYVTPVSEKIWTGAGGAKFEEGDTLFARITPCLQNGKIAQAKKLKSGKGFGSTEYFVFRGIENISDSDFIYYLSQTEEFRKHAIGSMVGASGRQRADATYVGSFELNFPPLHTQRKIASILSAYDDLIENNLKRIKLLNESAQRTYEEWFVKFRVNGEQFKIKNETGLPDGWERKKLGDALLIKNGRAYKNEEGEKINSIYGSNGIIGLHPNFNNEDAIIIGRVGAYCGAIFYCRDKFWATDNTITVKEKTKNFSNSYAYFTLINLDLRRLAGGSAQPLLTQTTINQIEVPVPDEKLVIRFTEICESIFRQIDVLTIRNSLLKESRDILLPRLINGGIKIKIKELETV